MVTIYVGDQPHYISDLDALHIRILTYAEYKVKSAGEIQSLLQD